MLRLRRGELDWLSPNRLSSLKFAPGLSQRSVAQIVLVNGQSGKGSAESQAQASRVRPAWSSVLCFYPARAREFQVLIRLIGRNALVENSECAPMRGADHRSGPDELPLRKLARRPEWQSA